MGHTLTPVYEQKPGIVSHLFTALVLRPRCPLSTPITLGPPSHPPRPTAPKTGSTHPPAGSFIIISGASGKGGRSPSSISPGTLAHHSALSPLFSWQLLSKPLQMPAHQALSVSKGLFMVG